MCDDNQTPEKLPEGPSEHANELDTLSDKRSILTDPEALGTILSQVDSRVGACIAQFLELTACGVRWNKSSEETGFVWTDIQRMKHNVTGFYEAYMEARDAGEVFRAIMAEDELFRRAVEGWEEAVYGQKGQLGTIKRFSDKLLEFYLKANRRAKYDPPTKHEVDIKAISFVVNMGDRPPEALPNGDQTIEGE